jgi:phage-related minor tail protein
MAERIKGITVQIGGDTTGLSKALEGVNKQIRSTQNELRDVNRLLKLDPQNTELLQQKQRLLAKAIEETKTKLDALKNAEKQVQEQVKQGKASQQQYDALKREIIDTETQLERLGRQAKDAESALSGLGNASETTATKTSKLHTNLGKIESGAGKVAKATKPLTAGIVGLGTAAAATVSATQELRSDLSKLDTAAEENGASIDSARKAWENFVVVTDETDSSVEATSNLLQAGFTESNLEKAVEGLSGAVIRFPDTLKVESLADSLQETLATGKATGQFGELLDRLGVGAENFNKQLAGCKTEAEQYNLVLETLADNGLNDTYQGWLDNNQEMAENKKANLELQQQLAKLAQKVQPILTKVISAISDLLGWFNDLDEGTQKTIIKIAGFTAAISPIAKITSGAASGIKKMIDMLRKTETTAPGATKAVSGLFGLVKAHPFGALAVGIGAATAGLLTWIGETARANDPASQLTDTMIRQREELNKLREEADANTASRMAEADTVAALWAELKTLVDENGRLIGSRERALELSSQINAIMPDTIKWQNDEKLAIDGTTDSLDLWIEKKKTQIWMEEHEQEFRAALKAQTEQQNAVQKAENDLLVANMELQRAQIELDKVESDENKQRLAEARANVLTLEGALADARNQQQETSDIITQYTDATAAAASDNLDVIKSFNDEAWKSTKNTTQDINEAISSLYNSLKNSPLLKTFGVDTSKFKLPAFANGGTLSSGSALVGEAGPELLTVHNGRATVTPLTKTTNVTQNLTFNGYSSRDGAAVVRDLDRKLGQAYGGR